MVARDVEGCRPRPSPPLASVHAAAGLVPGGAARDRAGRGHRPDRRRGEALHRRRLVAVVQRPWTPPSPDRPGRARPARAGRTLDDARADASKCRRAGRAAGRARPAGPEPRLLLGLGLHGDRGRAEDGVPVLAPARRPARPTHLVRVPARRLPRGHAGRRLGRRDRPLPLAPIRRSCSRRTTSSPATPGSSSACSTSTPRRSPRSSSSRSCRAPPASTSSRPGTCAGCASCATATTCS